MYRAGTAVGTTTVPSFADLGLAEATSYSYTVDARDAAGNVSAQSSPVVATTSGGSSGAGALDAWPGATAAYSFRKLRGGYAGAAVRLRRATDGAQRDIGFLGSGAFDTAAAATFCGADTCTIATWHDQSGNANHLLQADASRQWRYVATGAPSGAPVARCTATPCGMVAADSPSYKTADVHVFVVTKTGLPRNSDDVNRWIAGYPLDATVGLFPNGYPPVSNPWFFGELFGNGSLYASVNEHVYENLQGFGGAYRERLTQYDYSTSDGIIKFDTTTWQDTSDWRVAYPTSTGLHVGMAGDGSASVNGDFAELVIFGTKQADRDAISSNQMTYWGVTHPPASASTADGFTWAPVYFGNYSCYSSGAPSCNVPVSIRGNNYYSQGPRNSYSLWRATNTQGIDMTRFEVRANDVDDLNGSERSELSGSLAFETDRTAQMSYSLLVEPGEPLTNVSWNVLGQFHYVDQYASAPTSMHVSFVGERFVIREDAGGDIYTSAPIARGAWQRFFVEQRISSDKVSDVLKVWLNGQLVVNRAGGLFPNNGGYGGYWKFGISAATRSRRPRPCATRTSRSATRRSST